MKTILYTFCIVSLLGTTAKGQDAVSFKADIAPILINNCLACHGPKKAEGGYRVDTFERFLREGDSGAVAITAGNHDESESLRRIKSEDEFERMPLEGQPLSGDEITLIENWITAGAKYDAEDPKSPLATIVPAPTHPVPPDTYPRSVPITAVTFSPDGSHVVTGGYHEVVLWNAVDGTMVKRIQNVGQRTFALRFSNDGQHLVAAGGAPGRLGEARIFNATTGELVAVLGTTSDVVLDAQFNAAGNHLAVAGADSTIRIYEFPAGNLVRTISSHSDWIMAIAWDNEGKRLASASRDKTAKLFDIETGELLVTYSGHSNPVKGVAFHPDNKHIYTAGGDNKVHWWNSADGKKAGELAQGGEVYKLEKAGGVITTSSADKTIRQIDAATQKEIRNYGGLADWSLSSAFNEATKRIAGGAFDGTVKVWNAEDGAEVLTFVAAPGVK
ncbi:MAG: c-type cytochrome domain-containing protein [Planctomycetota bacterium]|nr:c-type cytochrome domain-containing protein [Planctomycetota bacterium]